MIFFYACSEKHILVEAAQGIMSTFMLSFTHPGKTKVCISFFASGMLGNQATRFKSGSMPGKKEETMIRTVSDAFPHTIR